MHGVAKPAIFGAPVAAPSWRFPARMRLRMEHFFDHEQLEVYLLARQFNRAVHKSSGRGIWRPRRVEGQSHPRGQIDQRNIAEGSDK
jgi:hypothetical protein